MDDRRWDLVVIGGGAAGNGAARLAGKLGFKCAMIERDRIGGTCTWVGCVPSKALLQAAGLCWQLRHGPHFGLRLHDPQVDSSGAMEWVREITNRIGGGPSEAKLAGLGVELVRESAAFEDERTVLAGNRELCGRRIVIATGSRPAVPPIEGLQKAGYLTNLTLFDLPQPPRSMIIIGGGPVGIEMAQAFNRLGTDVTVLEATGRILPADDAELAEILRLQLAEEGVHFTLNATATEVERDEAGRRIVTASVDGRVQRFEAEELLVAVGREAAVDRIGLERAGVSGGPEGIAVNDRLQTANPHIYAAGDALGRWQFTHMATIEGKHAVRNALLGEDEPMRYDAAGWCTFTDPELASVGINEEQAQERGLDCEVHRIDPHRIDRARIEVRPPGAARVIAEPNGGRILGAQILASRAGDIIQEFTAAISHGIPFRALVEDVHIYPTLPIAHYVPGQTDWLLAQKGPGWLERIMREGGFSGREEQQ